MCTTLSAACASRTTGKERDTESALDYFGARYYGSSMGRFMSPDPSQLFYADPTNPQSLNLYSYALNSPLTNTDPTGLYCDYSDHNDPSSGFDSSQFDFESNFTECSQNGGQFVNDAFTNNGADLSGRPQYAVSGGAINEPDSAAIETTNALLAFAGYGPKALDYAPTSPYTINFTLSLGMDAINKQIKHNCTNKSGSGGVGTGQAFRNTAADSGAFFSVAEAQLGAFGYSYSRAGGTVNVTVTNDITNNSLFYHMMSSDPNLAGDNSAGSPLDSLGRLSGNVPFGKVTQTLHIVEGDPCS